MMEITEADDIHIPAIQQIYAYHVLHGTATFETEPPDEAGIAARLKKVREGRASLALHCAAGFSVTGTLRSVGFKHGRWLDTVILQRSLGEGDTSLPGID